MVAHHLRQEDLHSQVEETPKDLPIGRHLKGVENKVKMNKPDGADFYDWEIFVKFFDKTYPNTEFDPECEEEYWAFWKAGFIRAMNM